jgi:hypothetical protein
MRRLFTHPMPDWKPGAFANVVRVHEIVLLRH